MKEKFKKFGLLFGFLALMLIVAPVAAIFAGCGCTPESEVTVYKMVTALGDGGEGSITIYNDGTWAASIIGPWEYEELCMTATGITQDGKLIATSCKEVDKAFGITESEIDSSLFLRYPIAQRGNIIRCGYWVFLKEGISPDSIAFEGGELGLMAGSSVDLVIPKSNTNQSFSELQDMLPDVMYKIFGDGRIEAVNYNDITAISAFDQATVGTYNVTATYRLDGDTVDKTLKFTIKVVNNEEEVDNYYKSLGDTINVNNFYNYNHVAKNTTKEAFVSALTSAGTKINGIGFDNVAVTADMISGFDTSKEGNIIITFTYQGETGLEEITVYDPDNIKAESLSVYSEDRIIPKGSSSAPWTTNWYFHTNRQSDNEAWYNEPNGYAMTYEIDGVAKTIAEIASTAGLKTVTFVLTKGTTVYKIDKGVLVYDSDFKAVTYTEFVFPEVSGSSMVGEGTLSGYSAETVALYDSGRYFDINEDGMIDLEGAQIKIWFNGKYSDDEGLVENVDFKLITVTNEMIVWFDKEGNQVNYVQIRYDIEVSGMTYHINEGIY